MNTTRVEDEIKPLKDDIERTQLAIDETKIALESAEESEVQELEDSLEFHENWLEERRSKVALLENENWHALLQIEIDQTEPDIGQMKFENQTHTYTHPTLFTLETYVEMSKWMQEKNIQPLLPWDRYFSHMTIYDKEVNSTSRAEAEMIMELFKDYSNKYSSTTVHYLFRLFGLLFSFVGAVFFLFLFGDMVTKEGLGRNGPIYLLQTQPIGRYKIIISKFLTTILTSLFILLGAVVFSIIIGSIFDRFGDWEYPVLIYGEDRTFTLMGMGMFLMKAFSMFTLILIFCYSILFLFSILAKRVLIAIGLTLVTLFIGSAISGEIIATNVAHFIPFPYFSVYDVLTNELALTYENFNFSYANGIVSLSIASFIIFTVTYVFSIVQTKLSN